MSNFLHFKGLLENNRISIENKRMESVIKNYSFFDISSVFDSENNKETYQRMEESKVIIISEYKEIDRKYFILVFERTMINIEQTSVNYIQSLIPNSKTLKICFLSDSKKSFDDAIQTPYEEIIYDSQFEEEVTNFIRTISIRQRNNLFKHFLSCIAGYLIKKSYFKKREDRLHNFLINNNEEQPRYDYLKNEFILLRVINSTGTALTQLFYYIEKEELVVFKTPNQRDDKLIEREIDNYRNMNHPFVPRFYGTIQERSNKSLIIEFINGQSLSQIAQMKMKDEEKLIIIFDLLCIFSYLKSKEYIYRDLKPNNVILDDSKQIVLIDFDSMINYERQNELNKSEYTQNFYSDYVAPEINVKENSKPSFQSDVFSLGKMILFILTEKAPSSKEMPNYDDTTQNNELKRIFLNDKSIFKNCLEENTGKRPIIDDLIKELFSILQRHQQLSYLLNSKIKLNERYYNSLILDQNYVEELNNINKFFFDNPNETDKKIVIHYFSLAADQNDPDAQYNLGEIYSTGEYITRDINKAIHYYSLAADQNHAIAQFNLGEIYYTGEYVTRDIDKAIHYYSLAADQNDPDAQFNLGEIYYTGEYVTRDINKAIHYYSLAADQNHANAQFNLSFIYSTGEYVTCDINKAIHYYSLAADQNHAIAQFNLGFIYYTGEYVTRDINKAIHYYSLAADQNHAIAQFNLGFIYYTGEYVTRDINKAIHYFSLAADQNDPDAQSNLGEIYSTGKYVTCDIDKAIHYYSLAADQNDLDAQYNLGFIYSTGKYVTCDIDKAIHYYSLAADQNHANAQFNLGFIYYTGKYVTRDIDKAIHYYSLAADQNHANAQFNLGEIYYTGEYVTRDINKAIHYYSLAADQNDPDAQSNLGFIYSTGKYVTRDINKAIHYYSLAADQNHANAQFNLGEIYYTGEYVTRDINKAIHYHSLAADQNDPDAQFKLGFIYSTGKYVTRDINKAIHYYSLAADQNHAIAQFNLGEIYSTGKYVTRDIDKAIHYYSLAADQNHANAQFNLGFIYCSGYDIKPNFNKAFHYYLLASNRNYPLAQYILGFLCFLSFDRKKGIHYLIRSSLNGNKEACFAVGYLYHEGKYINRDIERCIHFYKEASSFNNQYAKNNLGIIYKKGIKDKIQPRLGLSIEYFNEAIRQNNDSVSMYNLGHLYLYEEPIKDSINKSIDLLMRSLNQGFFPSLELLCISLLKKYGYDIDSIKQIIDEQPNISFYKSQILERIEAYTSNIFLYALKYMEYRKKDYIYSFAYIPISSDYITKVKEEHKQRNPKIKDTSPLFYEGFGIDLDE